MNGWCHGAAGIGMSRLGNLSLMDTPTIGAILTPRSRRRARAWRNQRKWRITCVVETWARRIVCDGRTGTWQTGIGGGGAHVCRANSRPRGTRRRLSPCRFSAAGLFSPSFFQGGSGIGYELLRLAYPEQLPNVLLWR